MADAAAMTKDTAYIGAIDRIWSDVADAKLYLTGGIGARHDGEMFGEDYELPNETAYNETCAAIANAMWNYRMFLLHGESKYIDVLEQVLYNGFLSGVSLSGDEFFYPNPLRSDGIYTFNQGSCMRQPWFNCSCCPTNVVRFLPSVPGYIYATRGNDLYVNLFIGSVASAGINGNKVTLKQETGYPWDGKIKLTIQSAGEKNFRLLVRIPGWAENQAVPSDLYTFAGNGTTKPVLIKVNNRKTDYTVKNGYAAIERSWKNGDEVDISIPMEIKHVYANEKVDADKGCVAYQRGPVVYCLEGIDNNGDALNAVVGPEDKDNYVFMPGLLNGIGVIHMQGQQVWKVANPASETVKNVQLTAIPYYAWANRGKSSMTVWIPEKQMGKR